MATTRDKVLSDPRSGARPLGNSEGASGRTDPPPRTLDVGSSSSGGGGRSDTPRAKPASSEADRIPKKTDLREAEMHRTGAAPLRGTKKREAEAGGYTPEPKSKRKEITVGQAARSAKRAVTGTTQRSSSLGAKHVLTTELIIGLGIVLVRVVADYEPQESGTFKGKIGHPKGQYGPLPIAAGLIVTFFILSFLVAKGGKMATVANAFGALVILTLGMKSVDEFDAVAKTFGNWGLGKKPPGAWETSGMPAGDPYGPIIPGSDGNPPAPSNPPPGWEHPKNGKCRVGWTLVDGKCWPNIQPGPPVGF